MVNLRSIGGRARRLTSLVGWTAIDQFFFALSNLVITLAIGRSGGAEALGQFTIVFSAYLLALGCGRALVSEPLLTVPRQGADHDRLAESATNTLVIGWAVGAGMAVAVIGLLLGRGEFVLMAVALPVVLLQDNLRYQAFRRGRPAMAALLDGGWLVGTVALWPVITNSGQVETALVCWAAAAVVGLGFGGWVFRPRFSSARVALNWWRREARGLARPLLVDSIIYTLSAQSLIIVVATMLGDDELGVLRAGQVYFAPLGLMLTAFGVLAVPFLAQRPRLMTGRMSLRLAAIFGASAGLVCVVVVVAEPFLRELLFRDSIVVPGLIIGVLAAQVTVSGASTGPVVVTKARRRGIDIVRARLASAVVGVVLLVVATAMFGLVGTAWALAGQTLWFAVHLGVRAARGGANTPSGAPEQLGASRA